MRLLFLLLALFSLGCNSKKEATRIGVDPSFYPLEVPGISQNVLGYTRDLLIEISSKSTLDLNIIETSWDHLTEDLKSGKYEACISSVPQYNFNEAIYNFSESILDVGLVVVTKSNAKFKNLKDLSGKEVGYISGSDGDLTLEKEAVIIREYPGNAEMLQAVNLGKIEACIMPKLIAQKYIANLYQKELRVITEPLTPLSLRVITAKKKQTSLISKFNKSLSSLEKDGKVKELLKKYSL